MVSPTQPARTSTGVAMAAWGENKHAVWEGIRRRHWETTARRAKFPTIVAANVLERCLADAPRVVEDVARTLPPGFPSEIADPILDGVRRTAASP